ncbi:MAG: hypothetical protein ACYS91_19405 [Planctomycetota bacterium]|jgi:hypothetical protein
MNDRNGENLKELFERFVSTEEAESGIEDFVKAERILHENPAPEPSQELVAAIKSEITEAVRRRQEHAFRRFTYKLALAAAVFVVLAAVGVRMLKEGSGPLEIVQGPIISERVWDSENVAADDMDLAVFTAEVDQLEIEFTTLERGENGGNGQSDVSELEMDFVEISNDIWEG